MRFKQYIDEARSYSLSKDGKWQRRQTGKGKAHWVGRGELDKYEITMEDGEYVVYDITQKGDRPNTYKAVGRYDSIKKAKESVG